VPESKKRKKRVYATATAPGTTRRKKGPSPVWLAPLMLVLFGIGIAWLVVFYVTESKMPVVGDLGNVNLAIGFGFIILGFGLSTQWR
jgi:hypothetical protein